MIRAFTSQFQAPFWSRIPIFGVRVYPKKPLQRKVFWISAVAYSIAYFYVLAVGVVVFVHSLWVWPGLQNVFTTTLYDICYRNWWLMLAFVLLEVGLIYVAAKNTRSKTFKKRRETIDWHRLLTQPVLFVAVLYLTLKLLSGDYTAEPNLTPVLLCSYVVSVGGLYIVDKYS